MLNKVIVFCVVTLIVKCAPHSAYVPVIADRIIGGSDADIEDYPYQLSVLYRGSHHCGAALINENWAISARHCMDRMIPAYLSVRAGSAMWESGGQVVGVKRIQRFPNHTSNHFDYDMALLEFSESINITKSASPIPLVDANATFAPGTEAVVTGWGRVIAKRYGPNKHLQVVTVLVVSNSDCHKYYGSNFTDTMLCAGVPAGGKDSCIGDSGGPLVVDGKLAGIVSWGIGCGRSGKPGVYASIASTRSYVTKFTGL